MNKSNKLKACSLSAGVLLAVLFGMVFTSSTVLAQDENIRLSIDNTRVVIGTGDNVQLTLTVNNVGKTDEEIILTSSPSLNGWDTFFRSRFMQWQLTGIMVQAGKSQDVEYDVKPPQNANPGEYVFTLKAASPNGKALGSLDVHVTMQQKTVVTLQGIKLVASYPQLSGPANSKFAFRADISNDTSEERTLNLLAKGPQGWNIVMKPAFESVQISSLRLKGKESKGIDIEVTPPFRATEGTYDFAVEARSDNLRDTMDLKALVVGNYELLMKTPGDRLNAEAIIGQDSFATIYLGNSGTAELRNINFTSTKPDGWLVTFEPDKVDNLPPSQIKEINVKIRPAPKAIAGDYVVTLRSNADQANASMDLRVTASATAAWGWIGLGIVVIVLAGLAGIFIRVGRR